RLPGTWKSRRWSQLGPASMTFAFHCYCTYESTVSSLFVRSRESGAFWTREDRLSFSRASGRVTTWPFGFEDDRLLLREHENETRVYEREGRADCTAASGSDPGG
ncbi:MAG: hypothetical protein R3234_07740, partial [Thermoanaerobaculia bacterium]|nr:hypothetical protein [Thermoanaerobaculia bacterium]